MSGAVIVLSVVLLGLLPVPLQAYASTIEDAQRFFYGGDYEEATAVALALSAERPDDLAVAELHSSILLFKIKRALRDPADAEKTRDLKRCDACPALMTAFFEETLRGQTLARARLKANPADEHALFFLGKLDLNYVWLQLGTLGRKTGWNEYWEARRSLDRVLKMNPAHGRARVARAWVDYIVGTKVPRGVRWLLGGGNKKRGLLAVRQMVEAGGSDFFVQVEALFALWDMQVREREVSAAVATAQLLARDFPENRELHRFLTTQLTAVDR